MATNNNVVERLSVIYRVVNMLFYIDPATECDLQTDLVIAPLPAKKQLWEASNEFAWKAESARELKKVDFGMATNGELVRFEEGQLFCTSDRVLMYRSLDAGPNGTPARSMGNWEEWSSGMDGLGSLIMLAASL
jgi:hypothetical protein